MVSTTTARDGPAATNQRLAPPSETASQALAAIDVYRRDRLLEAVGMAAKELLRSHDIAASLPKVAERIGSAAGVDRTHIFLIDPESGVGRIVHHCVWTVPGLATPPEFASPPASMAAAGLQLWVPPLERGETIAGSTRDFDPAARELFKTGNVKSVLAVPVFADGMWQGLIGFDDCRNERDWSASDIGIIKTVAELIGAAIARASHLKSLADANRIVENSTTILYRLAPRRPFPLVFISQNIERYGYRAHDLLAEPRRWSELIDPADVHNLLQQIRAILNGTRESTDTEFRLKKPDGTFAWFNGHGTALRDGNGRPIAIEGILTDITERKQSEAERSFSHILLTTAVESSPDAILIVDAEDRVIMFNQQFVKLWRVPQELADAGDDVPVLKAVASQMKDVNGFVARVRYLYAHPEIQSQEELALRDGRCVERHSGSLYGPQKNYLGRVWFFRDITEKKQAAEKIETMARTDSLTGLANRATFLDRMALEFARARRDGTGFAVHYIDLDHFKEVNDTLGHPVGDELLRAVADRLKQNVRATDTVARFGGDEFAVLQDNVCDIASIEMLADKLGRAIAKPYEIGVNRISTSASIGVAPYRDDIPDIDALMVKADLALYRAKDDGRDRFRLHVEELDEETRERMVISDELRHAAERGELELYYQPQVELASGSLVGLEALIRWNHPKRGLLLPDAFIPIAEATGNIVAVGDWVIAQACRQIHIWSESGLSPPVVAVNLSAAQFRLSSQLDKSIVDHLAHNNIAADRLELELTESMLLDTSKRHGDALERLRAAGFRLAIDDFGTGYSSLDYLRSFHVSRLKIDRSFIAKVMRNADDAAITRATIRLGHELGIEVLAEGVETAAQRDFLLAAGCKLGQGFYFAKPLQAGAAADLMRRNRQLAAS